MKPTRSHVILALTAVVLSLVPADGVLAQRRARRGPDVEQRIRDDVDAVLEDLRATGDFSNGRARIATLFQDVIRESHAVDARLFRDVGGTLRLMRCLEALENEEQLAWMAYLEAHPELLQRLIFLIQVDHEDPRKVFAVLERLRAAHGDAVAAAPGLAAALCVVHDDPRSVQVGNHRPKPPDPAALFGFYAKNAKALQLDPNAMPPELLVYVVSVAAPIDELEWAVRRYRGHDDLGPTYFDPEYDFDFFTGRSKQKKIDKVGFSVPNIAEVGGVCVERAYYAATVNQALGVPATSVLARGSVMGHAWLGYVRPGPRRGRPGKWNFSIGCFGEYEGLASKVIDPQLGIDLKDGDVAMLATLLDVPVESKEVAIAIADAALLVTQEGLSQRNGRVRIDERALEESLSLLDVATNHAPSVRGIWSVFVTLSKYDLLSPEHKAYWAERLGDLFGRTAPDFYVHTLERLIETEASPDARLDLWDDVYAAVRKRRPDLAAFALERKAKIHESIHQPREALKLYKKIIDDYHDAGPFVINALKEAEQVYRRENEFQLAVRMYQVTFQRTSRPSGVGGELLGASNWYRIGQRYAELLDEAGQSRQADQVRQELRRVLNG